jgi:RHS repeat-associated protein
MQMVGRKYTATSGAEYRFGFNGKEKASEISSDDYDFGARVYDGRLGRWLSVDPLASKYPGNSVYNFCSGNPIYYIDPDGAENIPALLWALKNMANKNIKSTYTNPYFGGSDNVWSYTIGKVPSRSVCYESCFISYLNSGNDILPTLRTGFTNKSNAFVGRSTKTGGLNWFKNSKGKDRKLETDITKGELGDIAFMGEVGDMKGHAVLLASGITKGKIEIDGTSFETATFYTLSTSSDTESGSYGGREFTFVKQVDGTWKQQGGSNYIFNGFGQLKNVKSTSDQKKEVTDLVDKLKNPTPSTPTPVIPTDSTGGY